MKKHVILSGEIGVGKTALICRALGDDLASAGGFATVRVTSGGKVEGFELVPMPALLTHDPRGDRFLDFTRGTAFDGNAFRTKGVELLRQAFELPFAVIDEVGGMELLTSGFYTELLSLLNSDSPWICVIKTPRSVAKLEEFASTGRDFASRAKNLRESLLMRDDTCEVVVSTRGDVAAFRALTTWAKEYATRI